MAISSPPSSNGSMPTSPPTPSPWSSYYQELHQGVYQICDGNVGKGTIEKHQTYLDVIVGPDQTQVKVWQNDADGGTVWKVADTILLNAPKPPPLTKPSTP